MVSLFVATEKETAVQLLNDGANIYVFFGVILGLQLESMMIFLWMLIYKPNESLIELRVF